MRLRIPYALLLPLWMVLVTPGLVVAQPQDGSGGLLDLYPVGDDYFFEVVSLPGPSTNRTRVVPIFSLTHNLMTFRADGRGGNRVYLATPRLYVEAIDRQGVVAGYGQWTDTIRTREYRSTLSKRERAYGFVEMELRPGSYTFRYSIDQGDPATGFSSRSDTIDVPDIGGRTTAFGRPVFLDNSSEPGSSQRALSPLVLDGNAAFGRPLEILVTARSPGEVFRIDYRVEQIDPEESKGGEVLAGEARKIGENGTIVGRLNVQEGSRISMEVIDAEAEGSVVYLVDDPAPNLSPGTYRLVLSLSDESGRTADTTDFRVRWIDRPLSLGDPTYAIRALRPIATDQEIDLLLSGNSAEKEAALERYWSRVDPTPGTDFNEKMAAYYRRVDYSYFNFATFTEPDGAKTDRGKIYILYGPPTDVLRQLDPEGGPREVWRYENVVGRTFIFRDQAEAGVYRLVEYYDL